MELRENYRSDQTVINYDTDIFHTNAIQGESWVLPIILESRVESKGRFYRSFLITRTDPTKSISPLRS